MFSYTTDKVPENYKCSVCDITNVKLWRQYQTIAPDLFCVDCALTNQERSHDVAEDGSHLDEYGIPDFTIAWLVPCVPVDEGGSYWGYTSIPEAGVVWWKRLPLRNKGEQL